MEKVSTSLFDGVSKEEYAAMMTCFKTTVKSYRRGMKSPCPRAEWAWCSGAGSAC